MRFKNSVLLVAACVLLVFAYRVQKGDTLWDLSEEYLKDPFAWPDLWKVNPHIEDPHWIYPGDSICIPGDGPCPITGDAVQGDQYQEATLGGLRGNSKGYVGISSNQYRRYDRPKIFNSYYQRLMPILESTYQSENRGWYRVQSDEANKPIHHTLEHEVLLGFGSRTFSSLKVGDIAELWTTEKVSIPNAEGAFDEYFLRRLAALAKITAIGNDLSRAIIVQSFAMLTTEAARCRPQTPFETINVKSFTQVKQAKAEDMARVLIILDKSIIASLYSYVLINKGNAKDYLPGSAVAFWDLDDRDPTLPPRLLGRGLVVHSDGARSTVLIRDMYKASRRIDAGTPVSITHQPVY